MVSIVASSDSGPRASGTSVFMSKKARIGGGVEVTHGLGYTPKVIMLTSDLGKVVTWTSKTSQIFKISAASTGDVISSFVW